MRAWSTSIIKNEMNHPNTAYKKIWNYIILDDANLLLCVSKKTSAGRRVGVAAFVRSL